MQSLAVYIGQKIREIREAAGMTQSQLAEALETTSNTVSRWETGVYKPEIDQVEEIARALRKPIWALLPPKAKPPENRRLGQLLSKAGDLPSEDVDELIRYADFIRARPTLRRTTRRPRAKAEGAADESH